MNEALLQSLVRLVTGRELPKLCTNCGAPAASFYLDGTAIPTDGPMGTWSYKIDVWVGCESCAETLVLFPLYEMLGALNDTL